MPKFEDFYFESSTGHNRIHARKCVPDGEARAVVQIVHGIAEYIDRYDDFMNFLAQNGFVAVGEDHLGHGKSVESPVDLGFFAEENGWDYVVQDLDKLREQMRQLYPDLPYIFFGHSMGSFLTRTYLILHPEKYDAAILSGTGHQSKALILGGCAAADLLVRSKGPRGNGKALNDMAFGSYCKKIDNPRTPFDWLSRDETNVDKYIADPLCGFVANVSLYRDMMHGIRFITDQKNIDRMSKEQPIYFMSGEADPVGDYGKGVERAYQAFCKAGLRDVTIRLYPNGRHEMLNETNKDKVYEDILNWLNAKMEKL